MARKTDRTDPKGEPLTDLDSRSRTAPALPAATIVTGHAHVPTEDSRTHPLVVQGTSEGTPTLPSRATRMSIAGTRIGELITELGRSKRTARIEVEDPSGATGLIFVEDGSIAGSSYAGESGPRALLALLGLEAGSFRILEDDEPARTTENHAPAQESRADDEDWDPPTVPARRRR